jgi:hypothetical protein
MRGSLSSAQAVQKFQLESTMYGRRCRLQDRRVAACFVRRLAQAENTPVPPCCCQQQHMLLIPLV